MRNLLTAEAYVRPPAPNQAVEYQQDPWPLAVSLPLFRIPVAPVPRIRENIQRRTRGARGRGAYSVGTNELFIIDYK